jgi:hypothetical protein
MSLESSTSPTMESKVAHLVQLERPDKRFSALAAAVRDHEARARERLVGVRPHDVALYRRLRQICGELEQSPRLPGEDPPR